jgi:hypothetical protein
MHTRVVDAIEHCNTILQLTEPVKEIDRERSDLRGLQDSAAGLFVALMTHRAA